MLHAPIHKAGNIEAEDAASLVEAFGRSRGAPHAGAWRKPFRPSHQSIKVDKVRQKTWVGLSAVVQEIRAEGPVEIDSTAPYDRLVVVLEESGARFRMRSVGPGNAATGEAPNRMYFLPAGTPTWSYAPAISSLRHLTLQFSMADLAEVAGDPAAIRLPDICRIGFADRRLLALARLFEAECDHEDPSEPLLGQALSISLLSLLSSPPKVEPRPHFSGGLTARLLRFVTEYMEANLGERIALEACADLVRLSPSHFHRSFKVSTGKPPHMWLTDARVRRARELLLDTGRPLAEIALETGFSDQSHFTRVFSRAVGQTPGAWRRGAEL